MNIYKLSQNLYTGYDTTDSMIVQANTVDEAKLISLRDGSSWVDKEDLQDYVEVELLGVALNYSPLDKPEPLIPKIIITSFNAG